MTTIEDFIYQYENPQREIMLYMNNLLSNELNLIGRLRFKIPFYYHKSWICYLNPKKNNLVEFSFIRGNELSNSQHLLECKGRKQVCSIELRSLSDMPLSELMEIIQEAILLDENIPYASKRNTSMK